MKIVLLLIVVLLLAGCGGGVVPFDSPIAPLPGAGDTALLSGFLMLVVNGGLAGIIVAWLLDTPIGTRFRDALTSALAGDLGVTAKIVGRVLAIVLGLVLSLAAYTVAMAFSFVANPGGLAAWLNLAIYLSGVSFPASQLVHGLKAKAKI